MNVTYAISLWNFSHYAGPGDLEGELAAVRAQGYGCLLYTSDAADAPPCVELGWLPFIKTKNSST